MTNVSADEWNSWLAENAGRLLLFARQQTRTDADAEDVMQEAMIESWQKSGRCPDAALVFATIRRRAIDLARAAQRRIMRESSAAHLATPAPWFDTTVYEREVALILEQALRSLPAEQQEVVTLKEWGGLTFAEIASALEIPPGTAASRYRLALARLKETLLPALS